MQAIKGLMAQELPRINAFIEAQIGRLDPLVAPVASHVLSAGGKRLRPLLTILCGRALGMAPEAEVYSLACSMEFLHSATLLHDDILDGAELRRGRPAAHLVFSQTETILAGDALLALANKLVTCYRDPRLVEVLADAVMRTAVGEIAEIAATRDASLCRSRYMEIITGKTAYLIQAACQVGAIYAGASDDHERAASEFGLNMGIAFQLVDDAMDYSSTSDVSGKPAGADLREGKLTLPAILLLESLPETERTALMAGLASRDLPEERVAELVERIQAQGLAEETREAAAAYADAAREALGRFPETSERDMLALALDFTLIRDK